MANENDRSDKRELEDNSVDAQKAVQEKIERIAEEAASRGGNRQKRYDGEHGIFTK